MKTSLKTFPEIQNFKQHSHDCIIWKIAFEKEIREKKIKCGDLGWNFHEQQLIKEILGES